MVRNLILATASAALLTQAALADSQTDGTLAPGKPSGTHQAQLTNPNTMIFIGAGVLVLGLGLYLAGGTYKIPGQSNQSSATSTSP